MADALAEIIIVSPLLQSMCEKLASPELRGFGASWGIEEQLIKLYKALVRISEMLYLVEENQIKYRLLKIDLGDLREVSFYADIMLDDFIYEAHRQRLEDERNRSRAMRQVRNLHFSLNETQTLGRPEISCVVDEIIERLVLIGKEIEARYQNLVVIEGKQLEIERQQRIVSLLDTRQKSSSLIVEPDFVVRLQDQSHLTSLLLSEEKNGSKASVVAIVGMGGLGKTTLAQIVYNDKEVQGHFEIKVWVCVPGDFSLERLTNAIVESITLKPFLLSLLDPNHVKLQDLVSGKRVLLVLDDVWNENPSYWSALLAPFRVAASGSRILVTTRSQKVASIMDAVEIRLQVLSSEDCWSLFKRKVFADQHCEVNPHLEAIGREIVGRCKGLPLAVTSIGGLLCGKLDVKDWEQVLESKMWDLEKGKIMPALGLSFHYLPAHLKLCFAYCSLFPKGYELRKAILVPLWMAEGFIPSEHVQRMEEIGREYLDDLFQRSFFQCFKKSYFIERDCSTKKETVFVMHELMHDMAQLFSMGMCFRIERDEPSHNSKKARTMSLHIPGLDKDRIKNPSSFLSIRHPSFSYGGYVLDDLFEKNRCLRVLDLSNSSIKSLPDSIASLKHLRYINLSCTCISVLPESICKLYMLQTLMLKDCFELHELPKGLGNLINLQYIVMENELWIDHRPAGIGRLTCLKTLPQYVVGQEDGYKIGELKELWHLEGLLRIVKLENIVNVAEAGEACLKYKRRLDQLDLEWSNGPGSLPARGDFEAVLEGLQPPLGLDSLTISWYLGLNFPNWMMRDLSSFTKLVSVKLSYCTNCKILPAFGQLPALVSLEMVGFNEVTHLTHEFYMDGQDSDGKKGFQKLKLLTFDRMCSWEEWYGSEDGEFPSLEVLTLKHCHSLRKLPPLLPTVLVVKIELCHSLTTFPRLPSICRLELQTYPERIENWVHQFSSLYPLSVYNVEHSTYLSHAILHPVVE